ncbi:MAG TPA: ECF transporter S component [Candidatus Binatus sp.]|nr:ECF transporter S component [Candidatus Binatus sp.]
MKEPEVEVSKSTNGAPVTVIVTITAVMTAFVFVVTYFLSVPIPNLGGQAVFDAGDTAIFISSLTFGPIVGAIAGGVGSGLSDAAYGSSYAPFTLVVKGLEGLLAGYVASRVRLTNRDVIGWALGATAMVVGYFLTNWFLIGLVYGANSSAAQAVGLTFAIGEAPFDTIQVVAGGLIGLPVSRRLRKTLPARFFPRQLGD